MPIALPFRPRPAGSLLRIPSLAAACAFAMIVPAMIPTTARACATCGCTLSTDAATGYSSKPGWRVSFEYDFIDQDRLRHGHRSATPAQAVDEPEDPLAGGGEIEKDTTNHYVNLGIAWHPNADWGFALQLPYVLRDHTTFGDRDQPFTPADIAPGQLSATRVSDVGDARLTLDYQGFLPTHNVGVELGVKLPTGRYGGQTEDGLFVGHPVRFRSGPMAGEALDTSLQPGTGSTDLIVGAYWYQAVSQDFDAFVNARFQAAIAERMDAPGADFRPGNQFTLSAGLRYEAHPGWSPQLQVNLLRKGADRGALADRRDSAGTVVYLSPGITFDLRRNVQAYGFVQLPVYSQLQGYQLFPRWTASVGISAGF